MRYEWSGILLVTTDNEIIAMHRDDKPTITNPGSFGIFGGRVEGNETALEAASREIVEETNLKPSSEDFKLFKVYQQNRENLPVAATLHVFILRDIDPVTLKIYEGQGIKVLKDANDPNISKDAKEVFEDWFADRSRP